MNKSQKILASFGLLTTSSFALADASLVKIGGGIRYNSSVPTLEYEYINNSNSSNSVTNGFKETNTGSIYAQIQHGIPYVPNYRINSYSNNGVKPDNSSDDTKHKIKHASQELFYSFNFAIIEAQLGVASHSFIMSNDNDGEQTSSGVVANIIIDIPLFPLTPSVNFDFGSGNTKVDSVGLNLAWSLFSGIYLDLGIKNYTYTFNASGDANNDANNDGIDHVFKNNTSYLGVSFNFGV